MNNLSILENKHLTITSVELVEIINQFRELEKGRAELQHKTFIEKIRNEISVLESLGIRGEQNFKQSSYINSQNKQQPCFELNRDGMLQMLNSEAALVRYKTIEYINKLEEKLKINITNKEQLETEVVLLNFAIDKLKLSDSGKITMISNFGKAHNIDTSYLPSYVDEKVTKPLTELLKQFNVNMSAVKFNKLLLEKGIIAESERNSSKGLIKKFKTIVNTEYGKNLINPKNPKEVQPHYYEDKFSELLKIVM